MKGVVVVAAATLFAATAAAAGERPAVRPSHDVAVSYRIEAAGPGGAPVSSEVRMYWTGQGTHLRLEMAGQPGYALIDFTANRMTFVIGAKQAFVELPFDPRAAPGLNIPADVTMTPAGNDSVAGQPCVVWDMRGPQNSGRACITQDGLVLQVHGGGDGQPALEATSVAYGPQPPSLFTIPAGFKPVSPGSVP